MKPFAYAALLWLLAAWFASGGPACPVPMMIASYVIVITIPQSVQLAYSVWFSHISNSNIQAPSYEAESSLA